MKRIISIILILIFALPVLTSANTLLADCALQSPGNSASDWSAIALLISKEDFDKTVYLNRLKQYVTDKYLTDSKLSPTKATEYHRIALAVGLAGEDATDFGGINLINDGIFYRENLGRQGINAYIWALITIASGNYNEPSDALNKTDTIIATILSKQNEDGSFSLRAGVPDCDITAMTVYALSAYKGREEVMSAINNAVNYLASAQNADGSFSANDVPNAETTAQVIIALSALGYDVKTDSCFPGLFSSLSAFRTEDGYSHTYSGETDVIATYQAVCASVAADRKGSIYAHITTPQREALTEEKEIPTKKSDVVTIVLPTEALTGTIEELPSLPQTTEVPTLSPDEAKTEAPTVTPSVENQQNSYYFYIFISFLIVIILICGIIIRRLR